MKINFKRQPDYFSENGLPWKIWQVEKDGNPAKNKFDEPLLISYCHKHERRQSYWHNYDEDYFESFYPTLAEAKAAVTAHLEGAK